ncbi:hypothetical protein [Celeribacter neptunius]|uniref:Transglycosylase SLT domain-containing protein n=1 Tax=Celeribacter neptunius TaxID=588602 RepID=A0A1I3SEX8_9RHOB|nr:hypothetical protein [Celeribacter neptunius]SFJ56532.1 hypothetical protein SAMN04487991_2421 [Celeribacter neptunius]
MSGKLWNTNKLYGLAQVTLRAAGIAAILLAPNTAQAAKPRSTQEQSQQQDAAAIASSIPYIVPTDYGGSVKKRLSDIYALRKSARKVEITGAACMSSCTMLLGLENTCVDPKTVFGFHGPSRNGQPLEPALFDQVSKIISRHYPAELQVWYMTVARYNLSGINTMTGAELIRLGAARSCETNASAIRSPRPKLRPSS